MACLAPQFKYPSPPDAHFRPSLHSKARDSVCSRSQCVMSHTAVIEIERIPTLEARPTDAIRPLRYASVVGHPKKASIEATLATENLLTGEEALIAAAAAEAVALARAAVKVAKGAAQTIGKNPLAESDKLDQITSEANILKLERIGLTETEWISRSYPAGPHEANSTKDPSESTDVLKLMHKEPEIRDICYYESIAVRSGRQTKRRATRVRTEEKVAVGVIPVKSRTSGKKKRSSFREIDFSDPLRYFRGTTKTKLLSAAEELECSKGIQDLLKLERLQEELLEGGDGQLTFAQWAAAAGVDQRTLRKRLNHGTFCKKKMIKSNIRLVISIAKKYQRAGLSLQDLIQEGCKGLVRSTEKFDASRGFRFSTYAHWWIRQALRRSLSELSRTIRLPIHMVEATYQVQKAQKQLYNKNKRHPEKEEIAKATGMSMKRLEAVLLVPKAPRPLVQKLGANQNFDLSEVIFDPDAETSEDIFIKQVIKEDLNKVLNTLTPREKQVMRLRFGLENERMQTLHEIGKSMGLSRERIRQIESCAFEKLKGKRRMRNLRRYLIS